MQRVFVTGGSGFIGTHVARQLEERDINWINYDIKAPISNEFQDRWIAGDIRDAQHLAAALHDYEPTCILHLAARTDTHSDELCDYDSNTTGTFNLVEAVRGLDSRPRLVFTSTQFVSRPGNPTDDPLRFNPHTTYGTSKVVGEVAVRCGLPEEQWVIVRPTNIWGPWHPRYGTEFWRVLDRGLYVHPSGRDATRTYGYVGNVAKQMVSALLLPPNEVTGQVFYLGEDPIPLSQWVDAFSVAIRGRPARRFSRSAMKLGAKGGDVLQSMRLRSPLTSARFRSMTEDYVTPVSRTHRVLGSGDISLDRGVAESVAWYREVCR